MVAAASVAVLLCTSIFNGVYRNANPKVQPSKPIVSTETKKPLEPFWRDWSKPGDKTYQTEREVEIETESTPLVEP